MTKKISRKIRDVSKISKIAQTQRDAAENVEASVKAASKLLGYSTFQKYKDILQKDLQVNLSMLLSFVDPDPVKYAFRVRSVIEQVNMALLLAQNVHADAKAKMEIKVCIATKMES